MADPNIQILQKETYLKMVENSIGTKLFNSVMVCYADSGKKKDVLNDGEFSCAFFVSGVLVLTQMLSKTSTTVQSMRKNVEESDAWEKGEGGIELGDVIFWEKMKFGDGSENEHVGFALSDKKAVSTSYKTKAVVQHSMNIPGASDEPREVTGVYRYKF